MAMNIAVMVANAGSPYAADTAMRDDLVTWGHTATFVATSTVDNATELSGAGYVCAVLGASWADAGTTGRANVRDSDIPVISLGSGAGVLDMNLAGTTGNAFSVDINVTDNTEQPAVEAAWSTGTQGWTIGSVAYFGSLGAGVVSFGHVAGDATQDCFLVAELGAALTTGNAAELRYQCPSHDYGSTAAEEEIFQAFVDAVETYLGGGGVTGSPWYFYANQ